MEQSNAVEKKTKARDAGDGEQNQMFVFSVLVHLTALVLASKLALMYAVAQLLGCQLTMLTNRSFPCSCVRTNLLSLPYKRTMLANPSIGQLHSFILRE